MKNYFIFTYVCSTYIHTPFISLIAYKMILFVIFQDCKGKPSHSKTKNITETNNKILISIETFHGKPSARHPSFNRVPSDAYRTKSCHRLYRKIIISNGKNNLFLILEVGDQIKSCSRLVSLPHLRSGRKRALLLRRPQTTQTIFWFTLHRCCHSIMITAEGGGHNVRRG